MSPPRIGESARNLGPTAMCRFGGSFERSSMGCEGATEREGGSTSTSDASGTTARRAERSAGTSSGSELAPSARLRPWSLAR